MKRFILVLIFFVCLLCPLCAEKLETDVMKAEHDFYSKGIGLRFASAGESGIGGISYQQWFENNLGFQGTAAFVINDYTTFYSFEAQIQKLFYVFDFGKSSTSHFFVWANVGFNSNERMYRNEDDSITYKYTPNGFAGLGFGFAVDFIGHISIPVQFGIICTYPKSFSVGMTSGISLLYRF